jgi:signal transduction histidine kinase
MCGGEGALILDHHGAVVASHAMNIEQQRAVAAAVIATASPVRMVEAGPRLLALPLQSGWLAVELSAYTPLFGEEEIRLMEALGVFADLALQRIDLFERERLAREEAERANTEMETLVYGVSHDLKSPIISLLGYIEYLKIDFGEVITGEGQRYIDRMTASALYMQDLIQDLLELSRIGRVQIEAEPVNLNELIAEVSSQVRVTHPSLTIDAVDLPVVHMNPVRARQLFTNLIENAARHGGRDDLTVRIRGQESATETTVSVVDDGVGIPEPYREKVFGVFERLAGPTDTGGTGMGLAVCRKIVDQLGGSIDAVDAAVGADIRISIPRSRVLADSPVARPLETTAQ